MNIKSKFLLRVFNFSLLFSFSTFVLADEQEQSSETQNITASELTEEKDNKEDEATKFFKECVQMHVKRIKEASGEDANIKDLKRIGINCTSYEMSLLLMKRAERETEANLAKVLSESKPQTEKTEEIKNPLKEAVQIVKKEDENPSVPSTTTPVDDTTTTVTTTTENPEQN